MINSFFLNVTILHYRLENSKGLHLRRFGDWSLGLNQQLFDMGAPKPKLFDINGGFDLALRIIKKFDLVMVAEHFDESMVLMASLLCWPLEHVASFRNNALSSKQKVFYFVQPHKEMG